MNVGIGRRRSRNRGADDSAPDFLRADVPRRRWLGRVLDIGRPLSHSDPALLTGRDEPTPVRVPASDPADISQVDPVGRTLDFDAFYRSQYPSVVRLSYSLCGSLSVAEDLAQEAFITAHRRWQRVEAFDRPDLWVRRVVINRSISHRRRLASERRAFQRLRASRREHVEPILADEAVWRALRELSPRQAEVLALFYVEDQPLSAVAEILGLGEETVKTHLKRGRAALAAKLGEELDR